MLRIFQRLNGYVDILLHSPRQGADGGPCDSLRNLYDAVEIARRADGEASLDDIHAQCLQRLSHLNLFNRVQLTAGHLLAVSQGCVENK